MDRVKLTKMQSIELEQMRTIYVDVELIVKMHLMKKTGGKQWYNFKSINDLSVNDLESALIDGYDIIREVEVIDPLNEMMFYDPQEDTNEEFSVLEQLQIAYKSIESHFKHTKAELEADLDYQLITLHDAIQQGDNELRDKTLDYLGELYKQLGRVQ